MTIGEATRQYQVILEHERLLRSTVGDQLTFEYEIEQAHIDTERAYAQLWNLLFGSN